MRGASQEPGECASTSLEVEPSGTTATGHRLLVMLETSWSAYAVPDRGSVTIGRDPGADICIAGQGVSRRHARLEIKANGRFEITDLGSRNGTRIPAGVLKGTAGEVEPGHAIGIGAASLVIQQAIRPPARAGEPRSLRRVASTSPPMRKIESVLDRVAASLANVLLLGETGVGKDVLAEELHQRSPRAAAPFLRINCASLAPTLFESELFGHERGAFTGAAQSKPGLLEMASGGTVFLDEIGELPLEMQAKLLLVLEERSVRRVGAVKGTPLDVRFLSATNRDLAAEVAAGRFRADLYYRLDGFRMTIPPLRERLEDLDNLVAHFLRLACSTTGRPPPAIDPAALDVLRRHPWPGNLRELRNAIERTLVLHDGLEIGAEDLWHDDATIATLSPVADDDTERSRVVDALAQCGGNQSRAAKLLGISRNTLIARVRRYGLARPQP